MGPTKLWIIHGATREGEIKIDSVWNDRDLALNRMKILIQADLEGFNVRRENRTDLQRYAVYFEWDIDELNLNEVPF